jgi:hypothetical protein
MGVMKKAQGITISAVLNARLKQVIDNSYDTLRRKID